MPRLLLRFNAAVIKEIPVDKTSLTVGRKPDNDIVIDNPAVSGHHCRIVLQGETYFVEDLESTNGTLVNEKRIMRAGLHHNDVVQIAKHSLLFVEDQAPADAPPPAEAKAPEPDATMQMPPEKLEALAKASSSGGTVGPEKKEKLGALRVLKGMVDAAEYELKGLSTYIGKSDRVQIPIKGGGLFGSAPEVAASIHRKPEGYVLVAVKEGYPTINGQSVTGQTALKDGDIIECGGTALQFFLKDPA